MEQALPICDQDTNCCGGIPEFCLDGAATVSVIQALADQGIKTVIVSLTQGTTAYDQIFTQMALAGEAPNTGGTGVYDRVISTGISLTDLLVSITHELAANCRFQLDSLPLNPDTVNVVIDGQVIPANAENGWVWDATTSPPSVLLVGNTCEYVTTAATADVQIVVGCPTLVD
jgi:hypothetical protein